MIENSQLLEIIGKTKTKNLIDDISKHYFEIQKKEFGSNNISKALSIVSVSQPKETEILDIGMSCIQDILSDNWGEFLKGILTSNQTVSLTDDAGTPRSVQLGGGVSGNLNPYNVNNNPAGQVGSICRIGKGTTPATRQDISIETAFTNGGIEDGTISTGSGGFNVGLSQIDIPCVISPLAGSGAISETGLFTRWHYVGGANARFLITRDNISPVVNFIAGQAVNIDYKLLLS